jgi:cyclic beta-1,2-glucan synthetase
MVTDAPAPADAPQADTPSSEIFSQDQLEAHAGRISAAHVLSANSRRGRALLPTLDESAARLDEVYHLLSVAGRRDPQPVPAEDWLRDNHHVVQDQVRQIRQDLPRRFYLELPKLAEGEFQGFPRVYVLARELIAHTAGRVDLDAVVDFTAAYQRTSELSIGETWAIPIMLRLALVEKLRRLADVVAAARRQREAARRAYAELADAEWTPRKIERLIEAGRQDTRLSPTFVVELLQWLRDQPTTAAPAWQALQLALQAQDDTPDEMLRIEHHREAAGQLEIGNVITTMRRIAAIDWTAFFERVSLVEQVLRDDPAGAYAAMDFLTRDRYRHSIEQLAKRSHRAETDVARLALDFANAAIRDNPGQDRAHHVGYYLISRGRFALERAVGYPPRLQDRLARFAFRHQAIGYLGTLAGVTAVAVASLIVYAARRGASATDLWIVGLVVLLPVSELTVSIVNLLVTARIQPRELPKLAMRDGIPPGDRTLVAVPSIVDSERRLSTLLHDLEVRFLGNRDAHLHFALLSDFPDADQASLPGEDALLAAATRAVDALNERYGASRFFFFHRDRRWNPAERRWMGWERKRGKLAELNRLLRGAEDTSFSLVHGGERSLLQTVRYVITLDSDTQLPMEAGRDLVGTLSHPLNRPRLDPGRTRVTEGYGILQPRVAVDVVSANRTAFAKVYSGHVGVDPYTTAVSDVYQDLFHEGSYVGKGIYDVDAFEAALANRVPENTLLSHDLFEGFYARAGLVTDIQLVDDYPSNYLAFAARQDRWVRGDWQIVRWVWPTVPDALRHAVPNTLPAIARWKIADNLRRSLLPPALVALLAAGWTVLPGAALLWTVLAVLVLAFPAYVQVGRSLSSRVRGVPLRQHVAAERENVITSARQSLLSSAFLAHQSWAMIDAIARTWWRLAVSHRRRLEWVSAERAARLDPSPGEVARRMWAGPAIAVGALVLVAAVDPRRLILALPMIGLWCLSPVIAYVTGQRLVHSPQQLGSADRTVLRKIARKTWRFFEDLLVAEDHWLIPDNYQENRRERIAHRTSPTNVGLQLLAALSACDLGYLGVETLVEKLERTFATLLELPRYRGHFYNWYDTRTLAPLLPSYISTVDSGNLAGHLLTLRGGLIDCVEHAPIIDERVLAGLGDLLDLCVESLEPLSGLRTAAGRALRKDLSLLRDELAVRPASLAAWWSLLEHLADRISTIAPLLREIREGTAEVDRGPAVEASHWLECASAAIGDRQRDLERFAPWLTTDELAETLPAIDRVPTLAGLVRWGAEARKALEHRQDAGPLRDAIGRACGSAEQLIDRAMRLAELADDIVENTEFGFLFDPERQLFSIGFSITAGRLDASYYDTLASEARLASFVAIAMGQISHEHWFKLGRSLTPTGAARALISWSASMFEYFMPLLVMRAYPGTLLDETYRAVLARQMQYGAERGVPWGISECAYNVQDVEGNYQYRAFGVPGLGLKRGLGDDLVVAPYATILAAPIAPHDVVRNLERLAHAGLAGRYGFYESIDYTPDRNPPDRPAGVVLPTFMAHHQGMSLLALCNTLHDAPMQRRFHADPRIRAADLLLQERIPHLVPLKNPPMEIADHVPSVREAISPSVRRYATPHTLSPRAHLLSNGSYSVMVTNAGGGLSRRHQIALTRWREDITADAWGSFCYLRDLDSGTVWSTTFQPTEREPEQYEVTFAPDRATWRRVDDDIETRTEVVVSPEDDAEIRRVSVTNHSRRARTIELTSYAEVVLAPADADLAHPAFSNLFIETRSIPERDALLCVRRPRSGTERLYLVHILSGRGRVGVPTEHETDRARFIGRGRTLDRPEALFGAAALSNTTGPVLDPIVSLRQSVRLASGATARLAFTTAYAESEEAALLLVEKYHDRRAVARALALASTHSQVELRHLGLTIEDTMRFQRLGGRLLYGDPRLRDADAVAQNRRGQTELWKSGISGDLPILLVRVAATGETSLVSELLKAHEYLRLKGLAFDLVVLNEHPASYLQALQEELQRLVEGGPEQAWLGKPGGVFLLRADRMTAEDQLLLRAAARGVMDAADGDLRLQLTRTHPPFEPGPARPNSPEPPATDPHTAAASRPDEQRVELFNGFGGFLEDGREYSVAVNGPAGRLPPAPWTNVVANPNFGFACTESGPGYTWSVNSHDNRLTPWSNDPIRDQPGEAIFIRDESSGGFWSATPLPAGGTHPYETRHGQGYSAYHHTRDGVESELVLFVPADQPVKIFRLRLKNTSPKRRRLSVTLYAEWVLGENRSRTGIHVVTGTDPATGAVIAHNVYRQEFPERVAFLDLSPGTARTVTGDRTEFIGRNGSLARPAALRRDALSNRTGAALDPCGAVQVRVDLEPLAEQVLVGLLGDAGGADQVAPLVERYRNRRAVDEALAGARHFWEDLLGTTVVRTPDRAMDLLLNRWLLYQTLACRIWGRSAFYQSSGAFGFRDQLQDTLAFLPSAPALVRGHLIHAASRQFVEGDVQHWWHEPGGQGVRTRFSDDRLWLIYAALQYIDATGDTGVLDEQAPFLTQRTLRADEHDAYERPSVAPGTSSLYEHCVRAMLVSLGTGEHGLPLMGSGDWNDGMNLVGAGGKGESVWLAWLLISILRPFAALAAARGDDAHATDFLRHADALAAAVEDAWDGEWYRRAYFDDGTPLGSRDNVECQIDAIAQSWAVLSGAGDPARAARAMAAVDRRLVHRDDRLVLLLTPPFDTMTPSPGYIQGYVPGVRENGGQYTHAAAWTVMAFARLGDGDRAVELFSLLNPINHSRTPDDVERYRAEPYVVAADIYSTAPHTSRGGWTWYTGSAGWMYRVGIEAILGVTLRRGQLHIDPCIPRNWPRYEVTFRHRRTTYRIVVENPAGVNRGVARLEIDGVEHTGQDVPIADDAAAHVVRVVLG